MLKSFKALLNKAAIVTQDLIFARFCYLCLKPRQQKFPLCRACLRTLVKIHHQCPCCGLPLPLTVMCGRCLISPPPINQTISGFLYEDKVRQAILTIKYQNGLHLLMPFSQLLYHQAKKHYHSESWPSALIAVPSHPKKMRSRGYNQSLELTKMLCRLSQLPNLSQQVNKNKATADQSSLSLKLRQKNLRQTFSAHPPLPSHVAIIDDVITSGTTVFQLAIALKKQGVKKVDVWTIARTP